MPPDLTFKRICRALRRKGLVFETPADIPRGLRLEAELPGAAGTLRFSLLVSDDAVDCSSILPSSAAACFSGMAALLSFINLHVRFGHFDVDASDGEIRFSSSVRLREFRWRPGARILEELQMHVAMVTRYAPPAMAVAAGLQTPKEAYAVVEPEYATAVPAIPGGGTGAAAVVAAGSGNGGRVAGKSAPAKTPPVVRDYLLSALNVRGIIPLAKLETAIRNYLALLETPDPALPDRPHLNILLSGPPGTGKSEFVRHLGDKFSLPVVVRTAGDLLDKYVGNTEKAIRAAFAEAAETRSILFFDEFDGLLQNRGDATASWEVSHTNEILRAMEDCSGILVAATNLAERLDRAVLRRFTYKFEFGFLSPAGKEQFFKRAFAAELTEDEKARLDSIPNLAPGDFGTASQALRYLGDDVDNAARLSALAREAAFKNKRRKAWTGEAEEPAFGFGAAGAGKRIADNTPTPNPNHNHKNNPEQGETP